MSFLLGAAVALGLGVAGTAHDPQAQTGTVRIEVVAAGAPVAGATVRAGGQSAVADASGIATLTLPNGPVVVVAMSGGYDPSAGRVKVAAGEERRLRLELIPKPLTRDDQTIVASTRIGRRVEDQPLPVDVVGRGAIAEEMLMTPGSLASLLDTIPSLRMQSTSPELGTAMMRVQGLRGQYTRLLSDGVPLNFDHPGGLAPMQLPPMDLGQVEVVTGGASPIFGANALAGAVNLLSRRPGKEPEREVLFSQSMRGATDGLLWLSRPPSGSWSQTIMAGGHYQDEQDIDDDGWSDIPRYARGIARTRVLWDNRQGRSGWGNANVIVEKREGGSAAARQELETKQADGSLSYQIPFRKFILAGTGTLFVQSRDHKFSDTREHERRQSSTIEITLRGTAPRQVWVAGIAVDWFALRSHDEIPSKYVSTRPGMFVHDDVTVAPWLVLSGSARLDHHNLYGLVLSPLGSALVRRGQWSARISGGQSYFQPTPIMEETEAAGLTRLSIVEPLEKETVRRVSGEVSYATPIAGVSFTVFKSQVDDPALIDRATYTLHTDADPVVADGVQIAGTARRAPFSMTGTYAYVRARERGDVDVALTPRHTAGFSAAAADERRGRIGAQVFFTGEQRLDANPYRSTSESYVVVNLLGERPFGRWTLFANARNLTDVRQTNWDPIARPTRDVDGRWTVDAWAPLEGRVVNLGLKISF